ncbi:MAG: tRNA1(Val) (adenine(37)-N6)-methyltransferase [Thermodesulfobacteriota bacterium]
MDPIVSSDETLDTFFNGRLKVIQKKGGYRFSVDALLISQFVSLRKAERVIDLGTGCGIIPLILSQTYKAKSLVGVEIQKDLVECARKNVKLNHLESLISIIHQDFRELRGLLSPGSFDVVVSNPPYRRDRSGRLNPSIEKAIARHELKGTLEDLIDISSYLLRYKGRGYYIFTALRTVDLLTTLRKEHLEPKRVQFVHPHQNEEAKFILVEAVKSSGTELKILPPLILHSSHFFQIPYNPL